MEKQLILLMDKQKAINGYTMVEMIIVLMILSILMSVSFLFTPKQTTLHFFMRQLRDYYLIAQLEAIQNHEEKRFDVSEDGFSLGDQFISNPRGIVCDPQSFLIYPSGNVNHAGTIRCYQDQFQVALTIQLGSGHAQLK